MNLKNLSQLIFVLLFFISCKSTEQLIDKDDGKIQIAILQLNDVYEMNGVENGKLGGLSRVAHYYKQVQLQYPHTLMVMAGDFLNPSLIGTMKYQNESIKGKQMIEVLNAMHLDLAAFGNHEFDLDEDDLQQRINESEFEWIATNIYQVCGDREYPFYKERMGRKEFIPETQSYSFRDKDGTNLEVGIFSATIDMNPKEYVSYLNPDSCVTSAISQLKQSNDVVIGLTHLGIAEDLALAKKHSDVPLIMGGHDHDHMIHQVGNTYVTKADANAKTVYLIILDHNKKTGVTTIHPTLVPINEEVPKDPEVDRLIQKWNSILDANIKQVITEPYEVVYNTATSLDGRESSIRHKPTLMGKLFTEAMLFATKNEAQIAILNSGSIRIDDQLIGDIAAIDIFRALPYGGKILEIDMRGDALMEILNFSENAKGNGAYLQYSGISVADGQWMVGQQPLDAGKIYTIAINDFLLKGFDIPILTKENKGISRIDIPKDSNISDVRNDIRKAILSYLKSQN